MGSLCSRSSRRGSSRRGASMVGLLASMCIMLALVFVTLGMWPGMAGRNKEEAKRESVPKQVMNRAHDVDCQQHLRQARMTAQSGGLLGDPMESGPPSRSDLGDESSLRCPLCGLPYVYDPTQIQGPTGGLRCPYPHHQGL